MAKKQPNDEIEDVPVVDDVLLDGAADLVELPEATATTLVPTAHGPVAGKRTLGVKEPIVFKWKLIGTSNNMAMTLFKAVEREDVDAQFERMQREGYYTDLKILEADAKVEQPSQPKGAHKASSREERGGKAATAAAARPAAAKRGSASTTSPARKTLSAKSASKAAVKSRKKKTTGSAAGPKRASKKKKPIH